MRRRIVVTGMGAVTPIGCTVADYWQSLLAGRSGVGPITLFDASDYPTRIAAEVKHFDPSKFFDRKDLRLMARPTQFGVAAALMALADGGWRNETGDAPLGVVGGVSNSAQDALEGQIDALLQHGYRRVLPYVLTKAFPHSTASEAGRLTGFQDKVITLSTGCTSGMNSLAYAVEEIRAGRCAAILCISTDATISKYVFAGFCRAGLLSTDNDHPERASRPFDANRQGGVLGEGAAAFLLEEQQQARQRGARIQAEILGCASCGGGYRFDDPDALRQGMARTMQAALADANLRPEHLGYIGCHGVGDPHLDRWETQAVKQVFGQAAYRLPLSSVKSMIGIPQNAAAMLQAVATIQAINCGMLPPTTNYETPDPDCDLDYVPNEPRRNRVDRAMVFAHGFNGSDAAIILGRDDRRATTDANETWA